MKKSKKETKSKEQGSLYSAYWYDAHDNLLGEYFEVLDRAKAEFPAREFIDKSVIYYEDMAKEINLWFKKWFGK